MSATSPRTLSIAKALYADVQAEFEIEGDWDGELEAIKAYYLRRARTAEKASGLDEVVAALDIAATALAKAEGRS